VGLVWPALNGAMLRLKTSADDRPSVVLALFLQVVANVIGADYTLMDGRLPKFLPSDLPGNLKLMLKGLLRKMSQPYRKIQLNFDASGWNSLQGGVLSLQQQLLSMDSSTTGVLEVTYEEAWQGLDLIVEAVGKTKAYADFVRMLVVNKTADIIRFAESWQGVHKGVELSPKVTGRICYHRYRYCPLPAAAAATRYRYQPLPALHGNSFIPSQRHERTCSGR
jgi:hypothetical protein